MKGFDPKFKDFPDYIIKITKEIWEDRNINTLHEYYTKDIPVRMPSGVSVGNLDTIASTMATLAEFPDRNLLGQDVIWSGTPEEGMLSSHRILNIATHTGDGIFGKATGKKLVYLGIADCHAINNQINDEWLVRDQAAIVKQMGWDPKEYAADLIEREGGPDNCNQPLTPASDIEGPYKGRGNDNEWGVRFADTLRAMMNADFAAIERNYDRAVQTQYSGGATGFSHSAVDEMWLGLRASFSSATFTIDHQIGREDPMMPPRAAIRWSLHGKHDGWGTFGRPTGAEVYVLGISHVDFGPFGVDGASIRKECTLYDETSIWKQILMHTG